MIVGDENYGEGSSREHAAMSPRLLGCKAVIARSFARIHETNLKKQGVLALQFKQSTDYDQIEKGDRLTFKELKSLAPGQPVQVEVAKSSGETLTLALLHSMSADQIKWFKAGSAMNTLNRPVSA